MALGCGSEAGPGAADALPGAPTSDGAGLPDGGTPPGGADGGVETDAAPDAQPDQTAAPDAVDSAPVLPGTVSLKILNDTASAFKFPEDTRFQVWVVGAPDVKADVRNVGGKYETTLVVPAGRQELRLAERAGDGSDTIDYFQAATRTITVDVRSADNVSAEFHLKWHWEPQEMRGNDTAPACKGLRQIHFRDAMNGMAVFAQESNAAADYPHASAHVTEDGGLTWQVASSLVLPNKEHWFRPSPGNWFNNRHLIFLPDGKTALSVGEGSQIARSADFGKTWTQVPFAAPTWGPGNVSYAGITRSGPYLYVAAQTGGVQGSSERTSLSRSLDGGKTFQVILDRCARSEPDASCGDALQPTLPLGFAGIDVACGPTGHCISLGPEHILWTTDDFATWKTMPAKPPEFGCGGGQTSGRVVWLPGTMTAWVIVSDSGCFRSNPIRKVTTDGGATWSDWQPSPASPGGFVAFADANNGFVLEVRDLKVTHDGGTTFRSTGPAPIQDASAEGFRLTVLDAEHAWVTTTAHGSCANVAYSYIANWRK